ncbi:GntR family transcriptional regulator [Corynebacterium propinquum]|jgi:transcriptional regulator (gntR family)|uniref:GntR family transcriptional regulator n=1 Tax=Corynebacterium propinquum TaxID=43769 RepID=A0AAP4BZ03_9CORY|nr:GntR family transcriptional regulator [Corynebacterium propinquum]MCG7231557.1 GntR family transcriptional regulator [Corynebacterium propinquum]MCT1818714.1 GntR family transcriptional regulator [Corynebacterium propinquum]MDK4234376.1 GntR family transcriptional regulator [Corynebacterium propinquum]MDK4239992.1 GntR family transcriptional regulator [Corynebacterium propinquum]MDK4300028.1 GntR family transcriptional regulator [Corynebacterium propinquum]
MTSTPRYIAIADALRADIDAQVFPQGSYLPSEAKLTERFRVAPGTIRRALNVLVDEGTLSSRRGAKKTVIRNPKQAAQFNEFHSFAQWAYGQGKTPGGLVIKQEWVTASPEDLRLMDIAPDTHVLSVVRKRTIDGKAALLEHTHYPERVGLLVENLAPDLPSVTNALLTEYSIEFVAADHVFSVGTANDEESRILEISPGSPLLLHKRVSRDRFGLVLEHSEDKYLQGSVALAVTNTQANNPLSWTEEERLHS